MYIEEFFDTIFNKGYVSGKTPMDERVKEKFDFSEISYLDV